MSEVLEQARVEAELEVKQANLPAVVPNGHGAVTQQQAPRAGLAPAFPHSGPPKHLAGAIAAIMSKIGVVQNDGVNSFHRYKFPKMESILQKLTPLLGEHGIIIFQSELSRQMADDGKAVLIEYEFTVLHSSGEVWPLPIRKTGLSRCRDTKNGFDDKCFNKCGTQARKYFLKELFQIPTSDDAADDADHGYNDGPQKAPGPLTSGGERQARPLKKDHRPRYTQILSTVEGWTEHSRDLIAWGSSVAEEIAEMPGDWQANLRKQFASRLEWLRKKEAGEDPGEFKDLAEQWGENQGDKLRNAATVHRTERIDRETGEVIWDEAGERPATETDEDSGTPAQQAAPTEATTTPAAVSSSVQDPPFDAEEWIKDTIVKIATTDTIVGMQQIRNNILIPTKSRVNDEQWERVTKIYRDRYNDIYVEHQATAARLNAKKNAR